MPITSSIPAVSVPTESLFKGHPVITLPHPDDATKPGIQLGLKKLRAVLANEAVVKAFVAKHAAPKTPSRAEDEARLNAMAALLRSRGVSESELAAVLS